ncbi:hypothetical protein [Defluviitalea phaphyphila]|uniref:hypothetical protein n=1 Tax=Defluviitalea phaphyphila TaxID=1473580 RepID=UPI000731511C|nr:hypothetical protein [Defluviitalea phaphyphila]
MKKEKLIKIITIFTILSALITFISAFFSFLLPLYLSFKLKDDISKSEIVETIGGADGPTAIYISGQSSLYLVTIIFLLLTILGIIYLVINKHKKSYM